MINHVGFTSIGSGSLYMALLTLIYPLSTVELVGIDILLGVVITAVAGLIHMALGNVDLEITGLTIHSHETPLTSGGWNV